MFSIPMLPAARACHVSGGSCAKRLYRPIRALGAGADHAEPHVLRQRCVRFLYTAHELSWA